MSLSVLSQVELTALPGNRRKHRPTSGSQSHVIITDHQVNALQSPPLQRLQELPPVDLRFAKRHRDPQDFSFPPTVHSNRFQDGQVLHRAIDPHLLVVGIQVDHPVFPQLPFPELLQLLVQQLGNPRDLAGRDLGPTQLLRIWLTLRVETPFTYISAMASFRAFSDRHPRSKDFG